MTRRTRLSSAAGARRCLAALLAFAVLAAPASARAQDMSRAPCTLDATAGDVPSDQPDGRSAEVTGARPIGLANWNVRWWQRHRLWITVAATNRGDVATSVLPEIVVDLGRDGAAARSLVGDPLPLAPHGMSEARLTVWVPDDAKTLGVRLHAPADAAAPPDVGARFALACSAARFDVGEMTRPAAALLDEALAAYVTNVAEPLPNPRQAFDDVRLLASGAQDAGDVAAVLRGLMRAAGDEVSALRPAGTPAPARAPRGAAPLPSVELRPDGDAVLRLATVSFASETQRLAWAQSLHDRIAAAALTHPRAWIVDLRQTDGDDPWPAFAGLSSLLDGPVVGAFVTRPGSREWVVDRGAVRLAGEGALLDLQLPPAPPVSGPIAVLLSAHTTNVGEAVAVAFEGRPRTRFFGAPTRGLPELAVHARVMADGSVLTLLDTRFADRNGVVYRGPIEPDEPTDASGHIDTVPHQAVDWLLDEHLEAGRAH